MAPELLKSFFNSQNVTLHQFWADAPLNRAAVSLIPLRSQTGKEGQFPYQCFASQHARGCFTVLVAGATEGQVRQVLLIPAKLKSIDPNSSENRQFYCVHGQREPDRCDEQQQYERYWKWAHQ
jgi:hypothetical protein